MFANFDISFDENLLGRLGIKRHHDEYCRVYLKNVESLKENLQINLATKIQGKHINGSEVQNNWFPCFDNVKMDVFLSHSHQDIENVRAFAGWLKKELDVTAFIDSDLWSNIKDLEDELGRELNKPKSIYGMNIYDYGNTRLLFQHTNNMLIVALQQMIDKAESVFFLNSSNSVPVNDGDIMNATYSPWIYTEISCTRIVRRKPLVCYRELDTYMVEINESEVYKNLDEDGLMFSIVYPLDFSEFIHLNTEQLENWRFKEVVTFFREKYPLDTLYRSLELQGWKEFEKHLTTLGLEKIKRIRKIYE